MSKTKLEKPIFVPEEMMDLVTEIQELAKVRSSLNLGTQTGERNSAESLMSRRITQRVNQLSKMILLTFKEN